MIPGGVLHRWATSQSHRCRSCGWHVPTQDHAPKCAPIAPTQARTIDLGSVTPDEWAVFTEAVRKVARPDGEVHQNDMRQHIRGLIAPKHIATCYRIAKRDGVGLLVDTQRREESNDAAGRNTDKLDRIYALRSAA